MVNVAGMDIDVVGCGQQVLFIIFIITNKSYPCMPGQHNSRMIHFENLGQYVVVRIIMLQGSSTRPVSFCNFFCTNTGNTKHEAVSFHMVWTILKINLLYPEP